MDPTISTILGALLGALLTGPLTYYFTKNLMRLQEFNKAAVVFRSAFVEQIQFLDHFYAVDRAGRDIPDVLAAAADKHEDALFIFKDGFFSKKQRGEIEEAWKIYTGENKTMGKYTFSQYATINKLKEEDMRKLALERIKRLLKFAEPKD